MKKRVRNIPRTYSSDSRSDSQQRVQTKDQELSERPLSSPDFLIWQLIDSAFPTGGFAHSAGLEAAWQNGEVRNRDELASFLEASLHQLGHAALPFVTAAWNNPADLGDLDELCDVFTTNHVANRASRLQGKAFLTAVDRAFSSKHWIQSNEVKHAHLAPVFGTCLATLGIDRETTMRMFFFNHLRGTIAAAVRLNIVGPMEAQAMQHRLGAKVETILKQCETLALDDLAQTAPLLDVWLGTQDRLYSRLFQS